MKRAFAAATIILVMLSLGAPAIRAQETPKRLKRSESFLGIHFDFHAGDDCTEIGKNVDREMLEYIIDTVKPDYVQTDSKGHRGLTSYPTKVGTQAPGFIRDPLKIWREVTAERGVSLFVHHSGVWDTEAVKQHPEWAAVRADGTREDRMTSVFGPYVDELLIPQIKEMIDEYDIDGIWVDGESWATVRDWNENVIAAFTKETGITEVPRKEGDPYWFEFSEFCREGFRRYMRHYVAELHRHDPDFQIASNWAFTGIMPEPVSVDVNYISGDYTALNSLNSARLQGRLMAHQKKPWDLMAWSFTWTDGLYNTKTLPQLEQEASIVLALGGGFQAYFAQKRDGSIRKWQMELMGGVAKFCRARQEICHRAEPVPQIALVFSEKAYYRKAKNLFVPWNNETEPIEGILHALLESQNVVDVVLEAHLDGRMNDYPLIVYPEWEYIDPDFKNDLLSYVKQGGSLLVVGPKSAALFENELGVRLTGEPKKQVSGLYQDGWLAGINALFQKVEPGSDAKPFGRIYYDNDITGSYDIPATVRSFGQGKIAATYLNLGERYLKGATTVERDFINSFVRELFPEPIVEVTGSHYVEVSVNRKNGKLAVNLVNTTGEHANGSVYVYDDIPPVGPLSVIIRRDTRPEKVTLEPDGKPLNFNYFDGKVVVSLLKLDIHSVIVVE